MKTVEEIVSALETIKCVCVKNLMKIANVVL